MSAKAAGLQRVAADFTDYFTVTFTACVIKSKMLV
jgi:hypothetical protein